MAYHAPIQGPGHTPLLVGRIYVQFLRYSWNWNRYKLIKHNRVTGICVLRCWTGSTRYESESALTRWYLLSPGHEHEERR